MYDRAALFGHDSWTGGMARHDPILAGGRPADINRFVDVRRAGAAHDRGVRRFLIPSAVAVLATCALGVTPAAADETLTPGSSQEVTVRLPGSWTGEVDRLGVAVTGLVQRENGCLHPEELAGDTTCGAEDGELAQQLLVSVAAGALDGGTCVAADPRTALSLLDGSQARLSVADVDCLSLELAFPDGANDDRAQSDTIKFQLDIAAEGPGGVTGGGGDAVVVTPTGPGAAGAAAAADRGVTAADALTPAQAAAVGQVGQAGAPAAGAPAVTAPDAVVPPAGTPIGEVQAQVQVDGSGALVQTESSTTSLRDIALIVGGLFLVTVALGWVLFLAWRRRTQGRTA